MNPTAIYVGFALFTVAYIVQITAVISLTGKTDVRGNGKLSDYLFGAEANVFDLWPFFAIAILFPFAISVIPDLANLPQFESVVKPDGTTTNPIPEAFYYSSKFVINYVLILITLEFSLLYGLDKLPKRWKQLLIITAALDICAYLLMGALQRNVNAHLADLTDMSGYTLVFLAMAYLSSLVASLIVVIAVTKLNELK